MLSSVVLDVRTRAVIARGITHVVRPVTLQPTWCVGPDHRPDKPTPIGANVTRPHLRTGGRTGRADLATSTTVSLPAELRFVEVASSAVRAGLVGRGCDPGCERDLQLATDELASVLIGAADHAGQLRLTISDDDTDVYVRMRVPASCVGYTPCLGELTRLLLDAAVESYELDRDGDQLLGVLQRGLADDNPG